MWNVRCSATGFSVSLFWPSGGAVHEETERNIVCGGDGHRRRPSQLKRSPVRLLNVACSRRKPLEKVVWQAKRGEWTCVIKMPNLDEDDDDNCNEVSEVLQRY